MLKWILTAAAIGLLTVMAACSDDDDGDTTPTPSVCDQKDAVETAVTDLADIDVLSEGTDALNDNVANVKTELADLKTVASEDVQPEVDALDAAISDAEETLSTIGDDATLNEKIDDVQAALTGIATASQDLATALDNDCP
jgi:hypothetical protein